jgi:hypothetical protein
MSKSCGKGTEQNKTWPVARQPGQELVPGRPAYHPQASPLRACRKFGFIKGAENIALAAKFSL